MRQLQLGLHNYYQELKSRENDSFVNLKGIFPKWRGGDFFCGAGGVTSGIEESDIAEIEFAINHDQKAIETHKINNSKVQHFISDVRAVPLLSLKKYIGLDFLWMSAECTEYSVAKGGQSREADSRSLCEELYRFAPYLRVNYIFVENVMEFLQAGPLIQKTDKNLNPLFDKKGKPIMIPDPKLKGTYYRRWIEKLKELGWVNYEYKVLNSADFGSPTSRKRYFGVFSREGCPIAFPVPTHDKYGRHGLKKWVACKDFINLQEEGQSIFGRKKPLADNTLKRIAYGIKKYCLPDLEKNFILKYYGNGGNVSDIDAPLCTVTTKDRHALINLDKNKFITQSYSRDDASQDIDSPINTITTVNSNALITCEKQQFVTQAIHNKVNAQEIEKPLGTILTEDMKQVVTVDSFIEKHQFCEKQVSSIDEPLHTIVTKGRQALISVNKTNFITKYFGGEKHASSLESPLSTITTIDHNALVQITTDNKKNIGIEFEKKQFIDKYFSGENNVQSLDTPLSSILTNGKKALVTTEILNQVIVDIKMRFLTGEELKLCQGFRKDYQLLGPEYLKKKYVGNSVPPQLAQALVTANYIAYHNDIEKKAG